MKNTTRIWISSTLLVAISALSSLAMAAKLKQYQVTGPVVDLTDTTITVEKAKGDRWTIARDAITKTNGGNLKVGDRVTISYTMAAENIDVKPAKKDAPATTKQ